MVLYSLLPSCPARGRTPGKYREVIMVVAYAAILVYFAVWGGRTTSRK